MRELLIAIVGPTAIGKTGLALDLAQKLNGIIVNADSRQIYQYMDIGTAKPSIAERSMVPHRLFDIIGPDEDFSIATYQEMAYKTIEDIHKQGKLPFLVGGSGQYVWGVLEGWNIPRVPPNAKIRRDLSNRAKTEGNMAIHRELEEIDPRSAKQIDPRNVRRVIRALEVYQLTGKRFSDLKVKDPPEWDILIIGLTCERTELYRRIDDRVEMMIEDGFVREVRDLLDRGYSLDLSSMSSLGYREIGKYLEGEIDLVDAIDRIKYETHRYARQQYTWFRSDDDRIHWFESRDDAAQFTLRSVKELMANNDQPVADQEQPTALEPGI